MSNWQHIPRFPRTERILGRSGEGTIRLLILEGILALACVVALWFAVLVIFAVTP